MLFVKGVQRDGEETSPWGIHEGLYPLRFVESKIAEREHLLKADTSCYPAPMLCSYSRTATYQLCDLEQVTTAFWDSAPSSEKLV